MKKLVLWMVILVCGSCMSQHIHAQSENVDVDMISMSNYYSLDIVDVDPAMQEAIYNAYDNCLIKEVYKSNGNGSPILYKVVLETKEQKNLFVAFDESGQVLKVMPEDEFLAARKK